MVSLPVLKNTIDEKLRMCHVELDTLPAPVTTDPLTEIFHRVSDFCKDFRAAVFGDVHKKFVQHNRQQYDQLKSDIHSTCPDFRPFEDHSQYHNPLALNERPIKYTGQPLDLKEVQKVIDESVGFFPLKSPTLTPFKTRSSIAWEFPDYLPFDALRKLILGITVQWKEPSHACFERIFQTSSRFIDELVQHHFGQFKLLDAHIRSGLSIVVHLSP